MHWACTHLHKEVLILSKHTCTWRFQVWPDCSMHIQGTVPVPTCHHFKLFHFTQSLQHKEIKLHQYVLLCCWYVVIYSAFTDGMTFFFHILNLDYNTSTGISYIYRPWQDTRVILTEIELSEAQLVWAVSNPSLQELPTEKCNNSNEIRH